MKFYDIAQQIIKLKDRDLELRSSLIASGNLSDGYNEGMAQIHKQNAIVLEEIMGEIGYPTVDKVGEAGSEAAWLVIQHAIGSPAFMKKSAKLLENAVAEYKANPINLAYLTDRIAVLEGLPQSYGTQFDWGENGEMSPKAYDDRDLVDKRRRAIGLNTLSEQTTLMRNQVIAENQKPPSDYAQRKKDIAKWRAAVGWS